MLKKVVVLYSDPQNPPAIRTALTGLNPRFINADKKKLLQNLKHLSPNVSIAMDAICPKIASKIFGELGDVNPVYIGGSQEQLRRLPTGAVILDNWIVARKNIEQQMAPAINN